MVQRMKDMENPLINRGQVEKAVTTLLDVLKTSDKSSSSNVSLIDAANKIDLQFSVGKVYTARTSFSLDLPHSIDEDAREVCLFVEDLDLKDREYEKTMVHFQDMFKKKGVTNKITKIIPIKALRTDYCQPHNRRTLAKAYDLFLADRKVTGLLPALLGKIFYGRVKTVPRKVHLDAQNLKLHLDTVINSPLCEMHGKGFSSHVQVAHDKMSSDEITDNTLKALEIICSRVPGGRNNIRSVHMSSPNRKAIPLYFNHVDPSEISLPEVKKDEFITTEDEVTTVEDGLVRIRADGYVQVISNKRKVDVENTDDVKEKKLKLEIKDEINVDVKEEDDLDTVGKSYTKKSKKDKKKGEKLDKKQKDTVKQKDKNEDCEEIKDEEIVVKEEQGDEVKVEKVQMVSKTNKKGKRKGEKVKLQANSKDAGNKKEGNAETVTSSKANKENKKGLKNAGSLKGHTTANKSNVTVNDSNKEMKRKNKKVGNQEGSEIKKQKQDIPDLDKVVTEKVNKKGQMEKKRKNKKKQ